MIHSVERPWELPRGRKKMIRRINLVPEPPFHEVLKKRANILASILLVIALIIPGVRLAIFKQEIQHHLQLTSTLKKEADEVKALEEKALALRKEIEKLHQKISTTQKEVHELGKRQRLVPDFRGALLQIALAMEEDMRLKRAFLSFKEGTLEGETRQVASIPTFLERLKKGPGPIKDAEIVEIEKVKGDRAEVVYTFNVHLGLKGAMEKKRVE